MLIGMDVGGTNLRLGVLDAGVVVEETRVGANFSEICKTHSAEEAWHKILEICADSIKKALERYPNVRAIGIGFPGFIDPITQRIAQSPNLPGLLNVDLTNDLSSLVGLPVIVENDGLVAAYGEFCTLNSEMEEATYSDLIYVGLGTGVGSGLILNGRPYAGQHGMSMEIGHMITVPNGRLCGCGNQGCMEQYASASGVVISYKISTGKALSADAIAELARDGDEDAIDAYEIAGLNLGIAVANILKVLDVRIVSIGGGMSQSWDLLAPTFQPTLDAGLIPLLRGKVEILVSVNNDLSGIIGAALLSVDAI